MLSSSVEFHSTHEAASGNIGLAYVPLMLSDPCSQALVSSPNVACQICRISSVGKRSASYPLHLSYRCRMTKIFFGTDADIAQIWRWLFDTAGVKIFEEYSAPDQTNRWFETWDEICTHLDSGLTGLAAWPATVGARPRVKQIAFEPNTQRRLGAKGRTALLSPATITLGRNNEQNGCLASASFGYWTEKGARQRSIYPDDFLDDVDWTQHRAIVSKLERRVIKSAPAKLRSYPVLPDAFERFKRGEISLWNWGKPCTYPSCLVVEN